MGYECGFSRVLKGTPVSTFCEFDQDADLDSLCSSGIDLGNMILHKLRLDRGYNGVITTPLSKQFLLEILADCAKELTLCDICAAEVTHSVDFSEDGEDYTAKHCDGIILKELESSKTMVVAFETVYIGDSERFLLYLSYIKMLNNILTQDFDTYGIYFWISY